MLNPNTVGVTWGTDPEGFFQKDGRIIGSEKLVPQNGINVPLVGKIVRDGVQFELNPNAGDFMGLCKRVGLLMGRLRGAVAEQKGVSVSFEGLVEVEQEELDSLEPRSQQLGCMPSLNVYADRPVTVDGLTYRKRSSGGHIHVGVNAYQNALLFKERTRLIPLQDIFVAIPSVLLDRDPGAKERRENYGRAGEHRLPYHGIEYRTLSNYWLRDPALMSLVFGMSNFAVSILQAVNNGQEELWAELTDTINIERVITAIETNDYAEARAIFEITIPFIRKQSNGAFPLHADNIDSFVKLSESVYRYGINRMLPEDHIFERWAMPQKEAFNEYLKRVS